MVLVMRTAIGTAMSNVFRQVHRSVRFMRCRFFHELIMHLHVCRTIPEKKMRDLAEVFLKRASNFPIDRQLANRSGCHAQAPIFYSSDCQRSAEAFEDTSRHVKLRWETSFCPPKIKRAYLLTGQETSGQMVVHVRTPTWPVAWCHYVRPLMFTPVLKPPFFTWITPTRICWCPVRRPSVLDV